MLLYEILTIITISNSLLKESGRYINIYEFIKYNMLDLLFIIDIKYEQCHTFIFKWSSISIRNII